MCVGFDVVDLEIASSRLDNESRSTAAWSSPQSGTTLSRANLRADMDSASTFLGAFFCFSVKSIFLLCLIWMNGDSYTVYEYGFTTDQACT